MCACAFLQGEANDQQTLGHEKAKACIGVGAVCLLLTVATAAARGELQRWARRSFLLAGSERKLSRSIGQCMELVYITLVVGVPFMVNLTFFILRLRPHDVAWLVASIFTTMTVGLSVREIRSHLVNYSSPPLQKHIVRILWMPPVYAVNCFISMRFDSAGVYLTVLRELYEAFCVWSFMALMIEFLHNVAKLRRTAATRESLHTEEDMVALNAEFERFDTSGDGFIDLDDLGAVFKSLNIELSRPELQDVMDSFDLDGDDRLDKKEFFQIMSLKLTDKDEKEAFDALDKSSSGTISLSDFVDVTMLMGFDEAQARAFAAAAPGGVGDQISTQQFHEILQKHTLLSVRLGILQRVGALWALQRAHQGESGTSDIRYREVAQMLEEAAEAARAEGHGHGHGEDGDGGCCGGCCKPAPCEAGEHPHMPPFHKARAWKQGLEFLHKCRVGVLQYVACQVRVWSFSCCSAQPCWLTLRRIGDGCAC